MSDNEETDYKDFLRKELTKIEGTVEEEEEDSFEIPVKSTGDRPLTNEEKADSITRYDKPKKDDEEEEDSFSFTV